MRWGRFCSSRDQDGYSEEEDVAGHCVGDTGPVVEVDDGVEQASGGGEDHGVGEFVVLDEVSWGAA